MPQPLELPAHGLVIEAWNSKRFGGFGCPKIGARTRRIQAIGIHCTDGSEKLRSRYNVCHWWDQPAAGGNAHLVFDASGASRYAADDRAAWHASQANQWSLGFEFCGVDEQTTEQWLDDLSAGGLRHGAVAAAQKCVAYGIQVGLLSDEEVRAIHAGDTELTGFCTHAQIDRIWPKKTPHVDPGPAFPMLDFLLAVRGYLELGAT